MRLDIIANTAVRAALAAFTAALGELPDNRNVFTYTITALDGSRYLTRTLLPRVFGHRPMIHHIHQADGDRHLHNHPWRTARFLIVSGGYYEERLVGDQIEERYLGPGSVNELHANTFHRISSIAPDTWTLGLIGERCQDWGFLVDGAVIPHGEYFERIGHKPTTVGGLS